MNRAWQRLTAGLRRFGRAVGYVQTVIILTLIYWLLLGPLACLRRGWNRLRGRSAPPGWLPPSQWTPPAWAWERRGREGAGATRRTMVPERGE